MTRFRGPKEWRPKRKFELSEKAKRLEGYLRGCAIIGGKGEIDLGDNSPVYVSIVHDGSGFNPAAAVCVEQNSFHNMEHDTLEEAWEIVRGRIEKDKAYVKGIQKEWGDRWEEILTESFDGKSWTFKDVAEVVAVLRADKGAMKYITITEAEAEEDQDRG